MSYGDAALRGGMWGMRMGALLGPLGAAVGAVVVGAVAVGGVYLASALLANQMQNADEEAEENLGESSEEETCSDCPMSQEERRRRLEEQAGVEQRTKGRTRHGERSGGMAQADEDFDSLDPSDVTDIDTSYGPGRTGTLESGDRITVRPGSSEGAPTLEIRRPNGRGVEIRYPEAGT